MEIIEVDTYLNIKLVTQYADLSATTILALSKSGSFPSPVPFDNDEVWLSAEIADWLEDSPLSPSNFAWRKAA